MNTTVCSQTNVLRWSNVFCQTQLVNLISQIETVPLQFIQQYPRRLFSAPTHQDLWLQYFDSVLTELYGTYDLQQIFFSHELPNGSFNYHKSHPQIGRVLIFSIDDFPSRCLRVIHDPGLDLAYAGPDTFKRHQLEADHFSDFEFRQNHLLVVENRPESRSWGFSDYVPINTLQRLVWIYLS